jgi:DNA-directed RNA polymerase specialized sigma24 family protein
MIHSMTDPERSATGRHRPAATDELNAFVTAYLPRLRAALAVWAGADQVDEAIAETLLVLSRQPDRVMGMTNPRGYLYRVARSKLRGSRRKEPVLPPVPAHLLPDIEPELPAALASLSQPQRTAVYLMAGLDWSAREVGDVLGIAPTTVHNHYQRGLGKLRHALGEVHS